MIQPLCMYTWCASQSYFLTYSLYLFVVSFCFYVSNGLFPKSLLFYCFGTSWSSRPFFFYVVFIGITLCPGHLISRCGDIPWLTYQTFLCGYLKSEVYATCPFCIKELKNRITQRITRNWMNYSRLYRTFT